MVHDLLFILAVLLASRALLAAVRFSHSRFGFSSEISRKALHAGMGLILAALPWLFASVWPVVVLCGVYVSLLIARRFVKGLDDQVANVIYGVERQSIGEFLFPVTVLALFVLTADERAAGNRAGYVAALLVLGLADAAAALVGRRFGMCIYPAPGGRKSIEGSLSFALIAFICVFAPLTFLGDADAGPARRILLSASIAMATMLIEALAIGGFDNVLVPLAALAMLGLLKNTSTEKLAMIAGAEGLIVLILLALWGMLAGRQSPTTACRATFHSRLPR